MARRWTTKAARKPPLTKLVRRMSKPFRRRTKPGAPPGTLHVDPEAKPPVISVIAYGPSPEALYEDEIHDLDRLQSLVGRYPVLWVNVDGLGDAAVIERLGEIFSLHPLALEDVTCWACRTSAVHAMRTSN